MSSQRRYRWSFEVLLLTVVANVGCSLDDTEPASFETQAVASSRVSVICHEPPGNPANSRILRVGPGAVAAHVAHGDPFGDASSSVFYVDDDAAAPGTGRVDSPFSRGTDAIRLARCVSNARANGGLDPWVEVHLQPGTYPATLDPAQAQADPTLEELTWIVNFPGAIRGSTQFDVDENGVPMSTVPGTETTIALRPDAYAYLERPMIMVTETTDGRRGDGAIVEGLVVDGGWVPDAWPWNASEAILVDKVQDFTVTRNLMRGFPFPLTTARASGEVSRNLFEDTRPALLIEGGSVNDPADVEVTLNHVTNSHRISLLLFGTSDLVTFFWDYGLAQVTPVGHPVRPDPDDVPDLLNANVTGNILVGRYSSVRFCMYGDGHYPYQRDARVVTNIENNTMLNHPDYAPSRYHTPIVLDAGYIRSESSSSYWEDGEGYLNVAEFAPDGPFAGPYQASIDATVGGNLLTRGRDGIWSYSFTLLDVTPGAWWMDGATDPYYAWLSDSSWVIRTLDNGLDECLPNFADNPERNPFSDLALNNTVIEDDVVLPYDTSGGAVPIQCD